MSKIDDLVREGLERHQAGHRSEAEALYLKALAKQPSHAAANHLLGVLLLQSGRATDAVPRLERAVKMQRNADYLGNLGTALNAAGRPADAIQVFDEALRLKPASPGTLNNRAMALKAVYRYDDAIASYRNAIELLPAEASFHRNLANALSELGEWHAAEAAYREALARRPGFPNAVTGLCNALLALNRHVDAVREMRDLTSHFPREPEIHRALGHALWQYGDPANAAAAYRSAIAIDPADIEAHRLLGLIVARTAPDDEVKAVENLLATAALTDNQRAQLQFTLGQAYEDMGEGDVSLSHYHRANELVRGYSSYDLSKGLEQIDSLIAAFSALTDDDLPPLQSATGPIFLVGLPRSGKTTLERVLRRDHALFPAGELGALANMASTIANRGEPVTGLPLADEEAVRLGERYLSMCERLAPGRRIIDTMPNNFLLVGIIRQSLPTARVIFCHRDTADHAAALYAKYFAQSGNGYAADLKSTVTYLEAAEKLRIYWNTRFPGLSASFTTPTVPRLDEKAMASLLRHLDLSEVGSTHPVVDSEPRLGSDAERGKLGRFPLLREISPLQRRRG